RRDADADASDCECEGDEVAPPGSSQQQGRQESGSDQYQMRPTRDGESEHDTGQGPALACCGPEAGSHAEVAAGDRDLVDPDAIEQVGDRAAYTDRDHQDGAQPEWRAGREPKEHGAGKDEAAEAKQPDR